MDEKTKTPRTNEDVVEELTKDLESSCIKVDNHSTSEGSHDHSNTRNNNNVSDDPWENVCKDERASENGKTDDAQPTEPTEEESLKERDLTLSDEEKENLRDECEQLKNEGNICFKNGDYVKAISLYTQGILTCPLMYTKERSILYANRAAAKAKSLSEKESAISDCTKAIELNPNYVKAYVRRAQLYEESEKFDEALEDFKKILTLDSSHTEANYAVRRLPPLINERNEKLKAEMLGKLKDLGNMVLKPFGLSTNNFKLQKDPNSGGYSVQFQQNVDK